MAELTEREKQLARRLEEKLDRALRSPDTQRRPETSPGKYSSPIGADDQGNPFPSQDTAAAGLEDKPIADVENDEAAQP